MTDISYRVAHILDCHGIAAVKMEGWRTAYRGMVADAYLDAMDIVEHTLTWEKYLSEGKVAIVAEVEDKIVGFIAFGDIKTPLQGQGRISPYSAEIYAVYVLSIMRGHGIGTQLMKRAANALRAMKHEGVVLWCLKQNKRSQKFYTTLGGQKIAEQNFKIGDEPQVDYAYGWRSLATLQEKCNDAT